MSYRVIIKPSAEKELNRYSFKIYEQITIVLSVLLVVLSFSILLHCDGEVELTHKVYWLTNNRYYLPVDSEDVISSTEEDYYKK